jgi:hypothetical protein
MSDLSDLHGVFPVSIRWNAEEGCLTYSTLNSETGERELKTIPLGEEATFVLDLATRERGYGLIKFGTYDMKLAPVGSPPPPWPGDGEEYKPALGCWLWNPTHGELRLETNAAIFRQAVANIWEQCRGHPSAMAGQQPVIRFTDRSPVFVKAVNKSFYAPVIKIIGWVKRDRIPGWSARAPTVQLPAALPVLPGSSADAAEPAAKKPGKARQVAGAKPGSRGHLADLIDDEIPDFAEED